MRLTQWTAALPFFFVASTAVAGGTASEPPPAPPEVDFSGLAATADVQKKMQDGNDHPVRARLITDVAEVVPGKPFRLGLHLTQAPEWHTYWKVPGDIGLPTDITWKTPEGTDVSAYEYPVPQRFEDSGIVSFGYDREVLLFAEVTLPESTPAGQLELGAEASWLVCKSSCIPGDAQLTLPVTVAAAGGEAAANAFAPLFDHYAKQHPSDPLQVKGISAEFAFGETGVKPNSPFEAALYIAPTGEGEVDFGDAEHLWPAFTSINGGQLMFDDGYPKLSKTEQGGLLVQFKGETFEPEPLPTDERFGGLVQVKVDGKWVKTELTTTFPWVAADAKTEPTNSPLLAMGGGDTPGGEAVAAEAPAEGTDLAAATPAAPAASASLFSVLIGAFFGGLVLNIMPCVLPVLLLKLYSLIEQTDITPAEQRTAGLGYTAGVMASFWALAAVILGFKAILGVEISWGGWMQFPAYIAAMATVCFAFGLSLFGVYEIPAFGANQANELGAKEGVAGYFFTGVFATLVATPCTAPMMGPAVAYAFAAPGPVLVGIFSLLGLGLAFPFLVIAFVPALYKFLPNPGPWMETFKQLLGFSMVAVAAWLMDSLMAQIGAERTTGFLFFLVFVSMASWIFGRWGGVAASGMEQLRALAISGLVVFGAGFYFLDLELAEEQTCDDGSVATDLSFDHEIPWQPFSEERVANLKGQPVFIDFTAEWCLTCKVNEKTILETAGVRQVMADHGVVPLKADWTRRDETITKWLRQYGKAGVPFYLVLPADPAADPIPLPEVITPGLVTDALQKAAKQG